MTKTLNTDDFDHGAPRGTSIHNIVYGSIGFTDSLEDDVLTTLLAAGVIRIADVKYHKAGETRLFVSSEGNLNA